MSIRSLPRSALRRRAYRTEVSPPKPRLRLRLRVLMSHFRLDHELADGRPASASDDRALRAAQLVDPATRRKVARSLRRTVADARGRRLRGFSSSVPTQYGAVNRCRDAMLGLAERLERPEPMSANAVAQVLVLLTDGNEPLYNPSSRRSLDEAIWAVMDAEQDPRRGLRGEL